MRSRHSLELGDLLDILDFVKNEDKYDQRIKELQSLDKNLQAKLKLVNSLEDVQALETKHWEVVSAFEVAKKQKEVDLEKLRQTLLSEYNTKNTELDKRIRDTQTFHQAGLQQMNEIKEAQIKIDAEQTAIMREKEELGKRAKTIALLESKWKNKVAALQQLLVE